MTTIAKPFGALLLWLYQWTNSYGLAVIIFALVVKVILLPFMAKSKRGTLKMARLQPQMKELEKKHGGNQQKYNAEVQKLYKREGVNPLGGCIWMLIPYPILIALYYAIRLPLTVMMGVDKALIQEGGAIYQALANAGFDFSSVKSAYLEIAETQFISKNFSLFDGLSDKLQQLDYTFLGLDLGTTPNFKVWTFDWSNQETLLPALGLFLIPVVAAILTWLTTKISQSLNPQMNDNQSMGAMNVMMPLMTLWFAFVMPAALGIYWIASSFFGIIQDVCLTKIYQKKFDIEDADRIAADAEREAELEEKRQATEKLKAENATVVNPNTSKRKQAKQARLEQDEKAAEWERKNAPDKEEDTEEPSRVGERRYARGRAYDPDRYSDGAEPTPSEDSAEEDASAIEETSALTEDVAEAEDAADEITEVTSEENSGNKEQE